MKNILILLALFSVNAIAKPVNINTGNVKEISQSLSGIGKRKAEEIIQYRIANGPFNSLNDLIKVKGIGKKTIEKNAKDILFSQVK